MRDGRQQEVMRELQQGLEMLQALGVGGPPMGKTLITRSGGRMAAESVEPLGQGRLRVRLGDGRTVVLRSEDVVRLDEGSTPAPSMQMGEGYDDSYAWLGRPDPSTMYDRGPQNRWEDPANIHAADIWYDLTGRSALPSTGAEWSSTTRLPDADANLINSHLRRIDREAEWLAPLPDPYDMPEMQDYFPKNTLEQSALGAARRGGR